ncbi:MAG TPA: GDP-mannose 4,6-dehydratase [Clostridia bacterium]|nr:GDP-mannose 4,6-dehydratase [Clostridia bacterium]
MGIKKEGFRSVLIFGGAGFIGSNWAQRLLESTEAKIHIFDNLSRKGSRHNLEFLQRLAGKSGRLQITIGDIREQAKVQRAVKHATEIYHFAAQVAVTTSVVDPRQDFDVNLGGTFNILEAARSGGNNPFLLFTSTNKVYGDLSSGTAVAQGTRYVSRESASGTREDQPLDFHSPYGCSKGAADQYVRDYARIYGLPTVVFRMSCIAGPRQFGNEDQGWVAHFLYSALLGIPVTIFGSGLQVRDVLHVNDLLRAFDAARENRLTTHGQIYNIGGGPPNAVSLIELISKIEELTSLNVHCESNDSRPGDQLIYITDHSKLTRDTAWRPEINVRGVLESLHAWFKRNRDFFAATRAPELPSAVSLAAAELGRSA